MAFLEYSIKQITAYAGVTPQFEPETNELFDTLTIPPSSPRRPIRVLEREGVDGHGVLRLAKKAAPVLCRATSFHVTTQDGSDRLARLRAMAADPDAATDFGVMVVYAGIPGGPYDLTDAEVATPPSRILAQVGALVPGAAWRFDYAIQLKPRTDAPTS